MHFKISEKHADKSDERKEAKLRDISIGLVHSTSNHLRFLKDDNLCLSIGQYYVSVIDPKWMISPYKPYSKGTVLVITQNK